MVLKNRLLSSELPGSEGNTHALLMDGSWPTNLKNTLLEYLWHILVIITNSLMTFEESSMMETNEALFVWLLAPGLLSVKDIVKKCFVFLISPTHYFNIVTCHWTNQTCCGAILDTSLYRNNIRLSKSQSNLQAKNDDFGTALCYVYVCSPITSLEDSQICCYLQRISPYL